jgi:hypothetical protein
MGIFVRKEIRSAIKRIDFVSYRMLACVMNVLVLAEDKKFVP